MGNDGGSIPDRRDLVKSKAKAEQPDRANQTRARWFFCALSKRPLEEPIASCSLGKLYNKDAVLEYLLDKNAYGDGEEICRHIRSFKDLKTLRLTRNTCKSPGSDTGAVSPDAPDRALFMCPLNLKEMNGAQPFVYIATCGCVFSLSGLKAVSGAAVPGSADGQLDADAKGKEKEKDDDDGKQLDMCPQCGAKYDRMTDILMLNPPPEEEEKLRETMERKRAAEPQKKGKKRKAKGEDNAEVDKAPEKKRKQVSPMPSTNPNIAAASRAVTQSLAEEEVKRKANMSQAVKSLYEPKNAGKKETFMTMGTFTRYA